MVDVNFCCSSFLAFRYIVDANKDFSDKFKHEQYVQMPEDNKVQVLSSEDIDNAIQKQFDMLKDRKKGILLSGGMDSAILASYMPGTDAYTFRFLGGDYQSEELKRAEKYAYQYNLNLHYIDVDWNMVLRNVDKCMQTKAAPVHSIEPQIYEGAVKAKQDGIDLMIIGDASDYVFGGMDKLLSRDWSFNEWYNRFIYIEPSKVLKRPCDIKYIFEEYRHGDDVDFLGMINSITVEESYSSYKNAFKAANMDYFDPYECLKMKEPLDLKRIRSGESKYLIRELFSKKYSNIPIPEKLPMPRPVDIYFQDWKGPNRPEFRDNIDMDQFSGNQKWLLWSLEHFLNLIG